MVWTLDEDAKIRNIEESVVRTAERTAEVARLLGAFDTKPPKRKERAQG